MRETFAISTYQAEIQLCRCTATSFFQESVQSNNHHIHIPNINNNEVDFVSESIREDLLLDSNRFIDKTSCREDRRS